MTSHRFRLEDFKAWLTEHGAIVLPPTNPYEILRVDTVEGIFVAYANKAGRETWPVGLEAIRQAFMRGEHRSLSSDRKDRVKLRHQIEEIAKRDGLECWFCENGFLSSDSREITIEHLVAVSHGGPNHISNLVLACTDCNANAGNLSVAEKVLIREKRRLYGRFAA